MTKKEFRSRVAALKEFECANICGFDLTLLERVNDWFGHACNVFTYAATSEAAMGRRLFETSGRERHTTYMSDLSIGEWCEGAHGVVDTIQRALLTMGDDVAYMAELVLCVNWKAWEMGAREKRRWAKWYSLLYDRVRDLLFDYYEGDEAKSAYLFGYLD